MKRIWRAFLYSMAGIMSAWRDEPAFREEAVLAAILIPLAFVLAPSAVALVLMVSSVLLVLALELLNTAVEATVNRIGLQRDELAKKAKDTASSAVFVGLVNVPFTWLALLLW